MLIDNANEQKQRYNVVIDGIVQKFNVPKIVAENYIMTLDETDQRSATMVPVTEDGLEILLG